MPKTIWLCIAFLFAALPATAYADLAAIHTAALPQETTVLAALDDAKQLESYSHAFVDPAQWKFPVKRSEVADRLGKDLGFLRLAAGEHPDNLELLLLTGMVARYAYNVDVEGSYETAMDMFARSEKLSPGDMRASWFRGTLQCQTAQPKDGADVFLALEDNHAWNTLPVAFWDDYMECAHVTGLTAHEFRAADYLEKLHAPSSPMRSFPVESARHQVVPFDTKKSYSPEEVWQGKRYGEDVVFTSTMCGVRIRARASWRVNALELNNGTCLAYFSTGPYHGNASDLHPSILLMVKRPENGENLQQFASRFTQKNGPFAVDLPSRCPAPECVSLKQDAAGMYGKDGNGHGRLMLFQAAQPEFPGLRLESAREIPKPGSEGMQYFRPGQIQQRIPGTLYYIAMLDAAASIEELAMKDFDFFLKYLTVE